MLFSKLNNDNDMIKCPYNHYIRPQYLQLKMSYNIHLVGKYRMARQKVG